MSFEFAGPGRIAFGSGRVAEAGEACLALAGGPDGRPVAFVVTGSDPSRAAPLFSALERAGLAYGTYPLRGEPSFEDARGAVAAARDRGASVVVGFGGGSALDLAKAAAALLANPGEILDYAELIGGGKPLSLPSLPCVAVPTTAGTGSEATRNAVLASAEHRVKVSLRSPYMLPALAIVDPELCLGLPPVITARTGMDALTQLIESFVGRRANPLTDAICRAAIPRAVRALPAACEDGLDLGAREDMSFASLCGGLALANAGLGAVHGLAGPLGGAYPVPHGAACAALLAPVSAANVRAMRERDPGNPALARYAELAAMLGGGAAAAAEDAPALLGAFAEGLGIEGLASFGLTSGGFEELAAKAAASSSMKGNPVELGRDELCRALESANCAKR